MENKFDRINRATRDFNNQNVTRENQTKRTYATDQYWNYRNNATYRKNNDRYSKCYF